MKRGIVGAANSQEEVANRRGPAQAEENRGRRQRMSGSRQVVVAPARPPSREKIHGVWVNGREEGTVVDW